MSDALENKTQDEKKMTYQMKDSLAKRDKLGRDSISALDMALLTRAYGRREAFDPNLQADDNDELELIGDDIGESDKAKSFGFFNWLGGVLFSKKISFKFNETPIEGRAGDHQVRGGAVPLFDGVVLDLKPASMEGRIEDKRQVVSPKAGGTPARLILSPIGTGFIEAYEINVFTIKAPAGKRANADKYTLEVNTHVQYRFKDGQILRADKIVKKENNTALELENPKLTDDQGNESKYKINKAIIDNRGITMPSASLVKNDNNTSEKKTEGEGNKKEDDEKPVLKVGKDGIGINAGDTSLSADWANGELAVETEDAKAKINFFEKTFSFSFSKGFSSEDDDKDKSDKDESDKEKKALVKKKIEKLQESWEKLKFAREGIEERFKTGTLPVNNFDEDKKSFALETDWPIVPGLNVYVSLTPSWKFGLGGKAELNKAEDDKSHKITLRVQGDKVEVINHEKVERELLFCAWMIGEAGITLAMGFKGGVGYILCLNAGLFAKAEVKGNCGDSKFAEGQLKIPLRLDHGEVNMESPKMNLKAGVDITAGVGAAIKLESELFGWEKELKSVTFKDWNLAGIEGEVTLVNKTNSLKLTQWKVEKGLYTVKVFGEKIKSNGVPRNLALDKPTELLAQVKRGKEAKESLQKLHAQLSEIRDKISKKGQEGVGGQGKEDGGAYNEMITELRSLRFDLDTAMQGGEKVFNNMQIHKDNYLRQEKLRESIDDVNDKIRKHQMRIAEMEQWKEEEKGKNKSDEEINKQAYTHYKGSLEKGMKGMRGGEQKQIRQNMAQEKAATKAKIIKYEEDRIEKLEKRSKACTKMVKDMQAKGKTREEIVKAYIKKSDGNLLKNYVRYTVKKKDIQEFEEKYSNKMIETHKTRYSELKEWLKKNGCEESKFDEPNREFAKHYYMTYKEKNFFSDPSLFKDAAAVDRIIKYERNRLNKLTHGGITRIELLKEFKAGYDKVEAISGKGNEEKDEVIKAKIKDEIPEFKKIMPSLKDEKLYLSRAGLTEDAWKRYQKEGGKLGANLQWKTNTAKAASKEDILAYEENAAENLHLSTFKRKDKELLEKVLPVWRNENAEKQPNENELKDAETLCNQWLASQGTAVGFGTKENKQEAKEAVSETVSLTWIMNYEKTRFLQCKPGVMKKTKELGKNEWKKVIDDMKSSSTPKDVKNQIIKKLEIDRDAQIYEWEEQEKFENYVPFAVKQKTVEQEKVEQQVRKASKLLDDKGYTEFKTHASRMENLSKFLIKDLKTLIDDQEAFKALDDPKKYIEDCYAKVNETQQEIYSNGLMESKFGDLRREYLSLLEEDNNWAQFISIPRMGGAMTAYKDVYIRIAEQILEEFGAVHANRAKKLREFMGLETKDKGGAKKAEGPEETKKPEKTDAEVWNYYRKTLHGGSGFAKAFVARKNGNYTIEDMLRFERYDIKEKSISVKKKADNMLQEKTSKLIKLDDDESVDSHYERYMKLKQAQEEKKSDDEIIKLYVEEMKAGKGYMKDIKKQDVLLDIITPNQILKYEESIYQNRINAIKNIDKNATNKGYYDAYRKIMTGNSKGGAFREKMGTNAELEFDKEYMKKEENAAEKVLTPEIILEYEEDVQSEKLKKHRERLERLKAEDITEENVLEIYKELNAGKGFFKDRKIKSDVSKEKKDIGKSANFDMIIMYEQKRKEFYEETMKKINEPVVEMNTEMEALKKQIATAHKDIKEVDDILENWSGNQAFTKHEEFGKLTAATEASKFDDIGHEKLDEAVEKLEQKGAEYVELMEQKEDAYVGLNLEMLYEDFNDEDIAEALGADIAFEKILEE